MIKPEQIPPDAMYAAWKAFNAGMTINDAIAAAINAWPGVYEYKGREGQSLSLPLTQENNDDIL